MGLRPQPENLASSSVLQSIHVLAHPPCSGASLDIQIQVLWAHFAISSVAQVIQVVPPHAPWSDVSLGTQMQLLLEHFAISSVAQIIQALSPHAH